MIISIVIPCFNISEFVGLTINSVLSQDYKNYELILIDDGSTDSTLSILESFEKANEKIKVYSKKNGGVSSARNLGISNSSGDYIIFLDGDDLLEMSALTKIVKSINLQKKVDVISFGFDIKSKTEVIEKHSSTRLHDRFFSGPDFLKLYLKRHVRQCVSSFAVSRSMIYERNLWFDEDTHNGEDQEFQIKMLYNAYKVYYCSDVLFHYQLRLGSAVVSSPSINTLSLIDMYVRVNDGFSDKNDELSELIQSYCQYGFFYVLKIFSGVDNKTYIDYIFSKDSLLTCKLGVPKSKIEVYNLSLKFLYKISPLFLVKLFSFMKLRNQKISSK